MLVFMVGGPAEALDEVRPLLLDIGSAIMHVGTVEQAAAMKLAVNLSVAIQMIAFSEGVLLAERYGVEPEQGGGRPARQRRGLADARLPWPVPARPARGAVVHRGAGPQGSAHHPRHG